MPVLITMPSLSPTMEKGNLVKWCKKEGDQIEVGDVVAEIDTDKAIMEVEALHKGTLFKIIVPEGSHDIPVKTPIAVLRQKNDSDEDLQNFPIDSSSPSSASQKEPVKQEGKETKAHVPIQTSVSEFEKTSIEKIKISPLARRIANEFGIDITNIFTGSGPGGRIVKQDVLDFSASRSSEKRSSGGFVDKKASALNLAVAKKLTKCKQTVPHFYMTIKADVSDLMAILKQLKESQSGVKITAGVFVTKAVALAVRQHPEVNVAWIGDDSLRFFEDVDISVAVAVDGGIYTPVIRNADVKSLKEIAAETKDLSEKARQGGLKLEEYSGGVLTISNVGACEVDSFYSILNLPQSGIISVARAMQSPVVREGCLEVGFSMSLGYAVDHRAIDGMTAGRFLTSLKKLLENPLLVML